MKLNKLLSVISLALFGAVSVSTGVALANRNAEPIKAENETWMTTFSFDLTGFSSWEGSTFEDIQVHCSGLLIGDRWHYLHESGVENVWTINLAFKGYESISGFEFGFNEVKGGNKTWKKSSWQTCDYDKEDHPMMTTMDTIGVEWSGDTFDSGDVSLSEIRYLSLYEAGQRDSAEIIKFNEDPVNYRYYANFDVAVGFTYSTSLYFNDTYNNTAAILNDSAADFAYGSGVDWFGFEKAGQYQIAINNTFTDNGIASISKISTEGYYLVGTFNEWGTSSLDDAIPLEELGNGDVVSDPVYFEDDTEFKCIYTDGNGSITWYELEKGAEIITIEGSLEDYPVYLNNTNIHVSTAGNYQILVFVGDGASNALYGVDALDYDPDAPVEYDLYVGDTKYDLTLNEGSEYMATVDLVAGQTLKYTRNGKDVDCTAKGSSNNNIATDRKVINSATEKVVYVDVSNKTIWAEGLPILDNGFHLYKNTTVIPLTYDENGGNPQYVSNLFTCEKDDELRYIHVQDNSAPIIFGNAEIEGGEQSSYFEYSDAKQCIVCKQQNDVVLYLKLGSPNLVWLANPSESLAKATTFATGFDTALAAICKDSGTDVDALIVAWGAQKVEFYKLSSESQNLLKSATKETTGEIGLFIAKYELIVSRYNAQLLASDADYNFLGRSVSPATAVPVEYNTTSANSSALIAIIVITSILAISTISVAVVVRNKKHN